MNPDELDVLVKRVQGGDKNAFTDILFAVERPMRIFLSVYASSQEMVDEVLQATFVMAYEKVRAYELRGTFLAWLKGIGRNLLLQELNGRTRLMAAGQDQLEGLLAQSALTTLAADRTDEDEQRIGKLQECLSRLPRQSRELVDVRYAQDLPLKKMALQFSKSETWLAVTLHRIRESLRLCMTRVESTP